MFSTTKSLFLFLFFIKYCHGEVSYDDYKTFYNKQVIRLLDQYESGNYAFQKGTTFQIYKPNKTADIDTEGDSVTVSSVEGRQDCLGLKTAISETIVLDCPEVQPNEPGCFYIFTSSEESGNGRLNDETQVEKACVEVLNERCVGIVTPSDWTLSLHCIEPTPLGNS